MLSTDSDCLSMYQSKARLLLLLILSKKKSLDIGLGLKTLLYSDVQSVSAISQNLFYLTVLPVPVPYNFLTSSDVFYCLKFTFTAS